MSLGHAIIRQGWRGRSVRKGDRGMREIIEMRYETHPVLAGLHLHIS